MLTAGTVVADHLRLIRQLGSGGMGSVWIAEQTRIGQHVAVKFLSTALLDHESARSRFDREAKLAAKIKSPHVVQIHDHGLTRGEPAIPYIVMELLDGQDLSKLLESEGPLGLAHANEVLSQVCDALTKAHEAGIVHRDIKPENVFVLNEARTFVKLLDFGVAHGKDGQIDRLTQTGLLLGTAHYMSPEQLFSGKDIDARADLWALAVLTYQMLSNELPFQAETFGQLCLRVRDGGFAPLSSYVNVPPGMDQWFARGLCTDRTGRFQTAIEMAQAFRRVLAGELLWDPTASQVNGETKAKPRENTGTVRVERSVISKAHEEALAQASGQPGVPRTERWGSQPGTSGANAASGAARSGAVGSGAVGSGAAGSRGAGSRPASGGAPGSAASSASDLSRGTLPSGEHPPFVGSNGDWQTTPQSGIGPNTPLSALEGSFGTEARGALAFNADGEGHKSRGRGRQLFALAAAAISLGVGAAFVFRTNDASHTTATGGGEDSLPLGSPSSVGPSGGSSAAALEIVVTPTTLVIEPLPTNDSAGEGASEIATAPSVDPSVSAGNTVTPSVVLPHTAKAAAIQKTNTDGKATSKANADVASDQATSVGGKGFKPTAPEKKKYRGF